MTAEALCLSTCENQVLLMPCGFQIHKERLLIDLFLVSRSSLCMMPAMFLSSATDTIPEAKSLKPWKAADMGQLIKATFSLVLESPVRSGY